MALNGTTYTYGQLCKKYNEIPISRKGLTANEYNDQKENHVQQISQKVNQPIITSQDSNKHTYYYINLKPEPKRKQQQRITREKKLKRGAIITIQDPYTNTPIEFDLESNPYTKTGIESYIFYLILNTNHNYVQHLSDFYTLALHSCGLYSQLLYKKEISGIQYLQQSPYTSFLIEEGFNLILDRLQSKIYDLIIKFQEKGLITIDTKYPFTTKDKLHPFGTFDTEFVDEYGELAKRELGYYFEYNNGTIINFTNSYIYKQGMELWNIFKNKRAELIQQDYPEYSGLKIKTKIWETTPQISKKDPQWIKLTEKEQKRILYLFFEVFREKLKHDIERGKITIRDIDLKSHKYLKIKFLKDVYNCYERFICFDENSFNNVLDFQIDTDFGWRNGPYHLNRIKELKSDKK